MNHKRVILLGFLIGMLIGGAVLIGMSWTTTLSPDDVKAEFAAAAPERMKTEDEKAAYKEGMNLFANGEYQRSLQVIGRQALHGHAGAQFAIGAMYMEGKGLPKDEQQAVQWFKLAAEQDHRLALQQLAWAYGTGSGVKSDGAESRRWFLRAAAAGDGTSQFMAGDMLLKGIGGPVDQQTGIYWLTKAASNGVQLARAELDRVVSQIEFESIVANVARQQGGKISLNEIAALADIYGRTYGAPPAYSSSGRGTATARSYASPHNGYNNSASDDGIGTTFGGAQRSVQDAYGPESASRKYMSDRTARPTVDSPIILNRAGPGQYSDSNGDIYTQAGPNGVVNTRTGEFSPTNH